MKPLSAAYAPSWFAEVAIFQSSRHLRATVTPIKNTRAIKSHTVTEYFFINSITKFFQYAGFARLPVSDISIKAETPQCCSTGWRSGRSVCTV